MRRPGGSCSSRRRKTSLFDRLNPLSSSDEEAMRRVQRSGDPAAFALIVRRWERPIQRLCTRMTGDAHRGEDLAQETFSRLFAGRSRFRQEARFSTYLWRIALNVCRDEHRKATRRTEVALEGTQASDADALGTASDKATRPDEIASRSERAQGVVKALEALPEAYRSVVVLRHYEGLRFREIAEVLGIPEGTVKSRMSEALARLARLLGNEADGEPQVSSRADGHMEKEVT